MNGTVPREGTRWRVGSKPKLVDVLPFRSEMVSDPVDFAASIEATCGVMDTA